LISMASLFFIESYRPGVVGTAIWFALGLLYFGVSGRNKLVLSPEEEFALSLGERGHPELGDYGAAVEREHVVAPEKPAS
jgi:ethanolamine permease